MSIVDGFFSSHLDRSDTPLTTKFIVQLDLTIQIVLFFKFLVCKISLQQKSTSHFYKILLLLSHNPFNMGFDWWGLYLLQTFIKLEG